MNERVAIFIDRSNFYHGLKTSVGFNDSQISFDKLTRFLAGERDLVGTYYYNAPLDIGYNEKVYWRQQALFLELRKIPLFMVVLCPRRKVITKDGGIQYVIKGDDINLAIDAICLTYENAFDTAVLVSGDSDFVPLVNRVQKLGKRIENASFSKTRSSFLSKICNKSIILDEIIVDCLKKEL